VPELASARREQIGGFFTIIARTTHRNKRHEDR
jgi:hypothetical protein